MGPDGCAYFDILKGIEIFASSVYEVSRSYQPSHVVLSLKSSLSGLKVLSSSRKRVYTERISIVEQCSRTSDNSFRRPGNVPFIHDEKYHASSPMVFVAAKMLVVGFIKILRITPLKSELGIKGIMTS